MAAPKGNKHGVGHGRPVKYEGKKTDQDVFEFASSYPVIDRQIAEFLKISLSTLSEWKIKYPSFSESLNSAKQIINQKVEAALFKRAIGFKEREAKVFCHEGMIISEEFEKVYPPDSTAMIFWLKNRDPNRWKDKQEVEHAGAGEIKIEYVKKDN